jgi:A/G-specific adenine glycosylase
MKRRKAHDIWKGLYDFYLVEDKQLSTIDQLEDTLARLIQCHKLSIVGKPIQYKHLLTHQRLYVHFLHVQATAQFIQEATSLLAQAGMEAFTIAQIKALPKPILIDNFLKKNFMPSL